MDSKVKIDLELRKEKAAEELRNFEREAAEQLERLQSVRARFERNPNSFTHNMLSASEGAYARRISKIQGAQNNLDNLQLKIDKEEARRGGRLFGIAVNKQTEAFAKNFLGAYVAKEMMNLGFAMAYNVGGDNSALKKAQGALSGASEGMMVGAAFGPLGAAIGAVTGGLLGLASESIKLSKQWERIESDWNYSKYTFRRDTGRNAENYAFDTLMNQNMRGGRLQMLTRRIMELESGSGDFSLHSLELKKKQLHDAGVDTEDNKDWRKVQEAFQRTQGEISSLTQRMFEEATKTTMGFLDPRSVNDSLAKQGLYTTSGAVDVKSLNEREFEEIKAIHRVLELMAARADKNVGDDSIWRVTKDLRGAILN